MHYVKRGPEPTSLPDIRRRHTREWVRFRKGIQGEPSHRWTDYRSVLKQRFEGLCAYCEEITEGEIDHFRPKSKFPELVYKLVKLALFLPYL